MSDNSIETVKVPRAGGGNMVARQTGSANEIEVSGETASTAIGERARATIEAKFIMARRFPRDLALVRERLLAACRRPRFAEVAIYRKPIGQGIEGPSIRMAEECARCMTNISTDNVTVYDDFYKRIVEVSATDLETNLSYPITITVEKTVERSKIKGGQTVRGQRINSFGQTTYIVEATDDEILNKVAALTSKALRTVILRLVPGDIMDEAMETCYAVRRENAAKDMPGARQKMIADFERLGVRVDQIADYLGHAVADVTLEEMSRLRGLWNAIADGEATWQEAVEAAEAAAARAARATEAPALPAKGESVPPPAQSAQPQAQAKAKPPANLAEAAARARATRPAGAKAEPTAGATVDPKAPPPPPPGTPEPDWAKDDREPGSEG